MSDKTTKNEKQNAYVKVLSFELPDEEMKKKGVIARGDIIVNNAIKINKVELVEKDGKTEVSFPKSKDKVFITFPSGQFLSLVRSALIRAKDEYEKGVDIVNNPVFAGKPELGKKNYYEVYASAYENGDFKGFGAVRVKGDEKDAKSLFTINGIVIRQNAEKGYLYTLMPQVKNGDVYEPVIETKGASTAQFLNNLVISKYKELSKDVVDEKTLLNRSYYRRRR